MTPENTRSRRQRFGLAAFARGHLSASDRLGETMCGLVTVLTFTLVAGRQVDEGKHGVLQLLGATVGCCVTWGLIDGVLYVLDAVSQRARRGRMAIALRVSDDADALGKLRAEVEDFFAELGVRDDDGALLGALRVRIAQGTIPGLRTQRDDWLGGLAIFTTQLLCSLPAVVPFIVLDEPQLALRVSNGCLVLLLFAVGFEWASEIGVPRIRAALVAGLLGLTLVAVSVVLAR